MDKNSFLDYVELLRPGHWFKNIVVLFGSIGAIFYFKINQPIETISFKFVLAIVLSCLVSSVNYAVNNICDEKNDSFHPVKKSRVLPKKKISKKFLFSFIIFILMGSLLTARFFLGVEVSFFLFLLFVAGIFYNVKPLRFKDVPFLDVISESVNNPIRILIGWFSLSELNTYPPIAFLMLFWSLGAIMMSAKRYAELKFLLNFKDKVTPYLYRNSYKIYSLKNIFFMVLFYAFLSLFFLGFLSVKFNAGLMYSLPIVFLYFIWLLLIMDKDDSPFREPEKLFFKNIYFSTTTFLVIFLIFLLYFINK